MPLLRSASILALAAVGMVSNLSAEPSCPVTQPNQNTPPGERAGSSHYGNGSLWTALPPAGRVVFSPGDPWHVLPDGSLSMKFPWWRAVSGPLTIEGRRLDAPAAPLRASIPEGYGDTGVQATALIFPTEGCWEVTGKMGHTNLTFVVKVEQRK